MHTNVYFAYIAFYCIVLLSIDARLQKRSGLNPISSNNNPSSTYSHIPTPRITEGIELGRGRETDAFSDRLNTHLHPELPVNHPIRPQSLSAIQYEEDKSNMIERITGKKRKREGETAAAAKDDNEAGTSGTKEKEEEKPKKKYRHHYRSSRTSKKQNEAYGKAFGAAGAAISKKAKSIYNAGKRISRNVRNRCDSACQRARQFASRLGNRIHGRRIQQTTQTVNNQPVQRNSPTPSPSPSPSRSPSPSPPLRSPSSSSSSSSTPNYRIFCRSSPSRTR